MGKNRVAGTQEKHDWIQKKLFNNTGMLGINPQEILCKSTEYELMEKGEVICKPDIYILTNQNNHYYEIKSGCCPRAFDKGMSQLEKILIWHQDKKLAIPELKLIMPSTIPFKYWGQMLDNLRTYNFGEDYRK